MDHLVLASEASRELPASPLAFGIISFAVLSFSLWLVLQWNKER